jgi:hypothetical protein
MTDSQIFTPLRWYHLARRREISRQADARLKALNAALDGALAWAPRVNADDLEGELTGARLTRRNPGEGWGDF